MRRPDGKSDVVEAVRAKAAHRDSGNGRAPAPRPFTLAELLAMDVEEPRAIIPGLLMEGACFLAGRSKLGKSWMALGFAIAIAAGGAALGKIRVQPGAVLYIALEDNHRRLANRVRKLLGTSPPPEGMWLETRWPRSHEGGIDEIHRWLLAHADARLVVVDTFAKFRQRRPNKPGPNYDDDYADVDVLQQLAGEFGVAILIVHHQRKMDADDPLDTISGTLGLAGGVDAALILERRRGKAEATLTTIGRDLEEDGVDFTLRWDKDLATWSLVGEGAQARLSPEKRRILAAVRAAGEAVGPTDVAGATGLAYGTTKVHLRELEADGFLTRTAHGRYTVAGQGET